MILLKSDVREPSEKHRNRKIETRNVNEESEPESFKTNAFTTSNLHLDILNFFFFFVLQNERFLKLVIERYEKREFRFSVGFCREVWCEAKSISDQI